MSRTYRKDRNSFEMLYDWDIQEAETGYCHWHHKFLTDKELEKVRIDLKRLKVKVSTDNKWQTSLPHWFRNDVNRTRRARDRQEIWKTLNLANHEEQCSKWNCRDNNAWGYW